MTRARLLSTVTAALLLAASAASAQQPKKEESPAPAPPPIQNAPAEKMAPNMKAGKTDAVTHKPAAAGETAPDANGSATTGQGAAAGSGKLTSEQRGKITTILKQKKVEQTHLTVSVKVGTRVPESVHSFPLPVEVVEVYPEWRGYDYILVADEIMIIDPTTHEVVAILPA